MHKLKRFLASTIGKKELMALTGLAFIGFLLIHLAGNLSIYGGSGAFNTYAAKLHSLEPFLYGAELGLLAVGVVHILFATVLVLRKLKARPQGYAGKQVEGGRSWGSRTMIYSGPYILVFVVLHLLHFTFEQSGQPIATLVAARFHDPIWVAFYAVSMTVVGLHISHGFWSGFQTLGLSVLRRGTARQLGVVLSWIFTLGFGLIPIIVYSMRDLLS